MGRYIIRRIFGLLPTILIIISLSFFIIRIAPGGPFSSEKRVSKQIMENIEKKYHMDRPVWVQYVDYLFQILQGDLGPSFKNKDWNVGELIALNLPNSILLGSVALLLALTFGVGAGIVSALRQNSWADYGAMSLAVLGISVPLFVIGPVLQLIFSVQLGWLGTTGWVDKGWQYLILPAITLAFPYFAYIARLSRASLLEVLRTDYVRTARAKGLSGAAVMGRHVLKGALLPVVSYIGPAFAGIITGSVVIESVFGIPGVGRDFVNSALARDYTMIMGTVIIYSVILIVMNVVVDVIYALLDPRVSYK